MSDLKQKMEAAFDPSDVDGAQQLAYQTLVMMRLLQRAVDTDNSGLRLGRDRKRTWKWQSSKRESVCICSITSQTLKTSKRFTRNW